MNHKTNITFYWMVTIGTIIMTYLTQYNSTETVNADNQTILIFESITMLSTLVLIPLSLRIHKTLLSKSEKQNKLDIANFTRMFLITLLIFTNIILFSIVKTSSILLCIAICWIIFVFFCKPQQKISE